MNRDSGTQLLGQALAAAKSGDAAKAQRHLARCRRIDPDHPRLEQVFQQVDAMLNPQAEPEPPGGAAGAQGEPPGSGRAGDGGREGLRQRRGAPSRSASQPNTQRHASSRASEPPRRAASGTSTSAAHAASPSAGHSSGRAADAAQSAEVRRVLGTKDLYEVLRVSRDATEAQIKRGYKLLARKVHPDRNPDPRATEAFQKMQRAQDVLLDGDKRAYYDQHGEEEGVHQAQQQQQHADRVHRAYRRRQRGGDPFEQMFFGGGGPFGGGGVQFGFMDDFGNVQFRGMGGRRRAERAGPEDEQRARMASLLQLLPVVLLLLFTLVPMLISGLNSPSFSLDRQGPFSVSMRTAEAAGVTPGLPYFVTRDQYATLHTSRSERHRVERDVDGQLRDRLKNQCKQQRMRRHATRMQAERAWDRRTRDILKRQAESLTLDSCDLYDQYFSLQSAAARARQRSRKGGWRKHGQGGAAGGGAAKGGAAAQGQAGGKGASGRAKKSSGSKRKNKFG